MAEFVVWAPLKKRVRVLVDNREHDMVEESGGWWHVDVPGAGPGTAYSFLLDDDETPLPDPRSLWQPTGVHSASRLYDHDAFFWSDHAWTGRQLPGSVLYELHIGTFTDGGTFDSAIEKLDHLVSLGIDLVEVLPVNAVDGDRNWGYDGVGWYAVTENYGGPDAFKRFVDACHTRGLGVVLDVVYNHMGPSGAYLDRFGPYFAGETIWGPTVNLDGAHSEEVRRYIIDNALMWLRDFHVDGLRLDAVHALHDTRARHVLEQLSVEVESLSTHLGRPLSLIAESDLNDAKMVTAREGGGYGLHAQWADDVHHSLHTVLTGEDQGYYADFATAGLTGLAHVLTRVFLHEGTWRSFRGRSHGAPVDTRRIPGHRFVTYLQDHDQVGNRAAGDRPRRDAHPRPAGLRCGAAVLLAVHADGVHGRGVGGAHPVAVLRPLPRRPAQRRGAQRPALGVRVARLGRGRRGARPDATSRPSSTRSSTGTRPRDEPHATVLATYRELIALRKARPELSDPWLDEVDVDVDDDARTIVLHRGGLRLAVNLGDDAVTFDLGRRSGGCCWRRSRWRSTRRP